MYSLCAPVSVEVDLRLDNLSEAERSQALSAAERCQIIEKLGALVNEFRLLWQGDWPQEDWDRILQTLEDAGKFFHIYLYSVPGEANGWIANLRRFAHFGSLVLSLPSCEEEVCAERGVDLPARLEFLDKCLSAGLEVNVELTLDKDNGAKVQAIADELFPLGINYLIVNRLVAPLDDPRHLSDKELLKALEVVKSLQEEGFNVALGNCVPNCFYQGSSRSCLGGVLSAFVDSRGHLLPCRCYQYLLGEGATPDLEGTSLLEESVEKAWRSHMLESWRDALPQGCYQCSKVNYCPGGCRTMGCLSGQGKDPLIRRPLAESNPVLHEVTLEEDLCPRPLYVVRPEEFGWALIKAGHAIPVSFKAGPVLEMFDGQHTLADIERAQGAGALGFIYSLYVRGFVELAEAMGEAEPQM